MSLNEVDEFHTNLKAKGIGAKGWANSWSEAEYLGENKFRVELSVGHRVFKDKSDDQWKKHKLIDDRPAEDYVLLQSAQCCVEVYPFYAKYFDINHEEVRVYQERWEVERLFSENTWRSVSAYNPVISTEEGSDYIKATINYDTIYGPLTVEYFQKDGCKLKHNIFFTNTSGEAETFRVTQHWAGIVGDKCNGKTVPVLEDTALFVFENNGLFSMGEFLWDMIYNPDGTEKADQRLQRPVRVEAHAQGMKADFIYGDWFLAHNEELTIDPATYSNNNPTVDGLVTKRNTAPFVYTRNDVGITLLTGPSVGATGTTRRSFIEWDVSGIPNNSAILDTDLLFECWFNRAGRVSGIFEMTLQPSDVATPAGDQTLYDHIGTQTQYVAYNGFVPAAGINKTQDLGADADADLEAALAGDWFAIGMRMSNETYDAGSHMYEGIRSEDYGGVTPPPTLSVTYILGDSEDLLGEFIVRQPASLDLPAEFVSLWASGSEELPAGFDILTLQIAIREHQSGAGPVIWNFSKPSASEIRGTSTNTCVGYFYLGFLTVGRSWIQGKRVRIRWQVASTQTFPAQVNIYDGELNPQSQTVFPDGFAAVFPGAGLLQTGISHVADFGPVTEEFQVDVEGGGVAAATRDNVTIVVFCYDDDNDEEGWMDVDFIEINEGVGGAGNLFREPFNAALNMITVATSHDYGTISDPTPNTPSYLPLEANLAAGFDIIQSGSEELLGIFELPSASFEELLGYFTSRQLGSQDLAASFDGQVSLNLLAYFTSRQAGSQELLGEFISRQLTAQELLGIFDVQRSTSQELPAEFITRPADSEDLLGEFIVQHPSSQELLGVFASQQAGSEDLLGRFDAQVSLNLLAYFSAIRDDSQELLGEFEVQRSASQELLGEFTAQQAGLQNLLGVFISQQAGFVELLGEFIAQQAGSEDLPASFDGQVSLNLLAEFVSRQAASQELLAEFISQQLGSEDLLASFDGQVSLNLLAEFISQQAASQELLAGFRVRQDIEELLGEFIAQRAGSQDLPASFDGQVSLNLAAEFFSQQPFITIAHAAFKLTPGTSLIIAAAGVPHDQSLAAGFEVAQDSADLAASFDGQVSLNLPAEFVSRQLTSQELLGEFVSQQAGSQELLAYFKTLRDGSQDLLGIFEAYSSGYAELLGIFTSQQAIAQELLGEFITQQAGSEDLPASFDGQVSLNLLAEFVSQQAGSQELLAGFLVRQWREELLGGFSVYQYYGNEFRADSSSFRTLSAVGQKLSHRFRAQDSKTVKEVAIQHANGSGAVYTFEVGIQADDGSGDPDGVWINNCEVAGGQPTAWNWHVLSNTVALIKGQIYHVVIEMTEATNTAGFTGATPEGRFWTGRYPAEPDLVGAARQIYDPQLDLRYYNGAAWSGEPRSVAFALKYTDNALIGVAYDRPWVNSHIWGGTTQYQTIIPNRTITIKSIGVYVERSGNPPDDLYVELRRGAVVERSIVIPVAEVTPGTHNWEDKPITAFTLKRDVTYRLYLLSPGAGQFNYYNANRAWTSDNAETDVHRTTFGGIISTYNNPATYPAQDLMFRFLQTEDMSWEHLTAKFVVAQDSEDLPAEFISQQAGSQDLPASFDGQVSLNLAAEFISQQAGSQDLLGEFVSRFSTSQELLGYFFMQIPFEDLLGYFDARRDASQDLLGIFSAQRSASQELLAYFTSRQAGSEDLLGYFSARRDSSQELLAKFTVRQSSSQELLGEFISRQAGSEDLLARFDGQVSLNLLAEFITQQPGSEDLLAYFITQQAGSQELLGIFTSRQLGSQNLLGVFEIRRSASQDLLGGFIIRRSASQELLAEFISQQAGSQNLLGIFTSQQDGSQELLGEFISQQAGSQELLAYFNIRRDANQELLGIFTSQQAGSQELLTYFDISGIIDGSEELLGEFKIRRSASEELLGYFEAQRDGSQDLLAYFTSRLSESQDLLGVFASRFAGSQELLAYFVSRFSANQELLGSFIGRQSGGQELLAEFISRQDGSQDLLGIFTLNQTNADVELLAEFTTIRSPTLDLLARFDVRLAWPLWTNRYWLNGVIHLDEADLSDSFLEEVITGVMDDIKTWLIAEEIGQYTGWTNIDITPRAIRRAATYGTVASLYARNVFGPQEKVIRVAPMDFKEFSTNEAAMEYWEAMMNRVLELYLSGSDLLRIWIDTIDEDPVFTMADIPLYTWSPDDYTNT